MRLLFVEDDTPTRRSMLPILKEYFKEVITAHDGQEGFELFKKHTCHIVMTDINMPKMNGIEMVRNIRALNEQTYVIIFSAYNDSTYLLNSIKLDVCDYLLKPFNINEFKALIAKCQKLINHTHTTIEEEISKYKKMAFYDQLTGIYNRHKFREIAKKFDKQRLPYGLLFFDIDNFKAINDTYGHDVGDEVLKRVTKLIQNHIRKEDYFGRWGGEEFLLLIKNTTLITLKQQAENLRYIIENSFFETVKHVTVSIGLSCSCKNEDFETVLKEADMALYRAKTAGKNKVAIL